MERIQAQLAETKSKLARVQIDSERITHERHDRKSPGYYPDKQLEELRNLQVRTLQNLVLHYTGDSIPSRPPDNSGRRYSQCIEPIFYCT